MTDLDPSNPSALRNSQTQFLLLACLLGAITGVLFILVQPLFGLDTLTSRHAALYRQLGGWGAGAALVIAWFAHSMVSVLYGLLCGIVVIQTERLVGVALYILALSWVTTVIAPPANAVIVQLVSFQEFQGDKLPGLNFNLDEKFVLHLLFFAVITAVLLIYKKKLRSARHA